MADAQVYYADGSPVPLEKAAAEVAAGKAFAPKAKPVAMLDETGTPVQVDSGNLRQAVEAGFQFEDPSAGAQRRERREYGTLGQQAITALEGGVRGASLGTSDALAGAVLGDEYSEGARKRQKVNPLTSGGSEILGALAPVIASGGTGALARGAALTPAGLAARGGLAAERLAARGATALGLEGGGTLARMTSRAAQLGASGAVEGALYGAGSEVSKAALEGTDLTAEKLLSGALEGGKFGGLTGAGMGAGGVLAGKAAEKVLGSQSIRDRARSLADESALKAAGFQGSDFRRLVGKRVGQAADDRVAEVGQELLNYQFKSGPLAGKKLFTGAKKAEDLIDDITFAKQEIGGEIGGIRRQVDEITKARPELAMDAAAYLKRVESEVLDPLRASNAPSVRKQAKRVEEELELLKARVSGEGDELAALNESGLDSMVARKDLNPDKMAAVRAADPDGLKPLEVTVYPDGTRKIQDGHHRLAVAKERGQEELPTIVRFMDNEGNYTREELTNLSIAGRPREPLSFSELEKFRRDLRDVIQPPKPTGGGLPAPVPEHAAHLEKAERMLSEELDGSVERALTSAGEDASKFKTLKREYSAFSDLEAVANKAAKQQLGNRAISPSDYGSGLGMAMGMLASGNVAGFLASPITALAHKFIRERGRSVLAQMADHVATLDDEAVNAVRRFAGEAGKVPRRVAISAESIDRRYDEVTESVKDFQNDPEKAKQVLASNVEAIAPNHPELAAAIQSKILGDYAYLSQQIPGQLSRADTSLTPMAAAKAARIPHAVKTKIVNIATALERPNSILSDLEHGRVPREKIEALKARRPEIFKEMRALVVREVAAKPDEIPYLDRVQLSLAFDFSGDKSLKFIGQIQADNSTPPPEDQQNPPGGASSLNPEKVAESVALPSARAEA